MTKTVTILILIIMAATLLSGCDTINNWTAKPTPVPVNPTINYTKQNETTNTTLSSPKLLELTDGLDIFIQPDFFLLHRSNKTMLIDAGNAFSLLDQLKIVKIDTILISANIAEKTSKLPLLISKYNPSIVFESGIPLNSPAYQLYKKIYNNTQIIDHAYSTQIADSMVLIQVPYTAGFLVDSTQNTMVVTIYEKNYTITFLNGCGVECLQKVTLGQSDLLIAKSVSCLDMEQIITTHPTYYSGDFCQETIDAFEMLGAKNLQNNTQIIINQTITTRK